MADKKEHHFCFAYRGERMHPGPFQHLNFTNVQSTSTVDGVQLVRVSLHRGKGRRIGSIPRCIQEYNALSKAEPIVPIRFGTELIGCFKMNQPLEANPILMRIEADRRSASSRYWSWSIADGPTQQPKRHHHKGFAGLEDLVLELNLDPSAISMQSAYDAVCLAYYQTHGVKLKSGSAFPSKDREFIKSELQKHFNHGRMYTVLPNLQTDLTPAAKAIAADMLTMDDLQFPSSSATEYTAPVNGVVLDFFSELLPSCTEEEVRVSFKEILAHFNRKSEGLYRRTCILPFMKPFLATGAVEADEASLLVHRRRVADQIASSRP